VSNRSGLHVMLLLLCSVVSHPLLAEALDDPMRPPVALSKGNNTQKMVTGYELSSIFISSNRRAAIINGRNVTIGDRVNRARVLEIGATEVVISVAGKRRILTLLPVSIKKPAEASR
jgi:MSHA biogenesis protein MshK